MSTVTAAATLPTMPAVEVPQQEKPALTVDTEQADEDSMSAEEASPSDSAAGKKKKQQTKGSYKGYVSSIGAEPKISIEGMGEFRFAYRNVKRQQNEGKPIVNLGDHVFCRLTLTEPPKAVCVRLLKKPAKVVVPTTPTPVPTSPVPEPMTPSSDNAMPPSFAVTPTQARAPMFPMASFSSKPDSIGNMSPVSAPSRPPSTLFTYDPYSFSGVRYLSQPPTPSSSMSMSQECTSVNGSFTADAAWCVEALSMKRCSSVQAM